jgi:5-methylcytosine-specific restriction endonuclease McrA
VKKKILNFLRKYFWLHGYCHCHWCGGFLGVDEQVVRETDYFIYHPKCYQEHQLSRAQAIKRDREETEERPKRKRRLAALAAGEIHCPYCQRSFDKDGCDVQWDHIIPRCKGGPYAEWNLIRVCGSCNSRKKGKDLIEAIIDYDWNLVRILEHLSQRPAWRYLKPHVHTQLVAYLSHRIKMGNEPEGAHYEARNIDQ